MASDNAVPMLNGEVLVTKETASKTTNAEVNEMTKDIPAPIKEPIECDVLVVGAGFSGMTAIHRFRKLGLKVKCFESGSDFGGVWYWNRYPGARVDSECPFYQLNIPEVYRNWHFNQRFSDHVELREYMKHIDKTLDLRKDVSFNARVVECSWDAAKNIWTVKTLQGHVAQAKYLVCCTGLLHRTYTPDFPGLKDYKGEIYHSGAWPEDFNGKGKKIGLIGAGATAVQITQELGKVADELTVFLRRPSYCFAMGQRRWTEEEQRQLKTFYPVSKDGETAYTKCGRYAALSQTVALIYHHPTCGVSRRLMLLGSRLCSKQVEIRSPAFPQPAFSRESLMLQKMREKSGLRICGSEVDSTLA